MKDWLLRLLGQGPSYLAEQLGHVGQFCVFAAEIEGMPRGMKTYKRILDLAGRYVLAHGESTRQRVEAFLGEHPDQ